MRAIAAQPEPMPDPSAAIVRCRSCGVLDRPRAHVCNPDVQRRYQQERQTTKTLSAADAMR